jgi:penicillin amidase
VIIRRDRWGIPHVTALTDTDAWFGLGFCHGQDRSFQLEILLRAGRGTLAELLGPEALPIDRLIRRLGLARTASAQLPLLDADVAASLSAYIAGVNAARRGAPRPHELVLLRARPTPWHATDVLAIAGLQSLTLSGNWDSELARLAVLDTDGPAALRAFDPDYSPALRVPRGESDGTAGGPVARTAALAADARRLADGLAGMIGAATGASNSWAIAPGRTRTGRALLANDPHLTPGIPPPWYLAHLQTPEWGLSGASFVGSPAFPVGQNGHAAWGITAGLTDAADLTIVELEPDGLGVRVDGEPVACEVIEEWIGVRGGATVVERILVTPWGPLLSPALAGVSRALALRAVWLEPRPVRGFLAAARARSFEDLRAAFADWPGPALNVSYADADGHIAYQLVGQLPHRRRGYGLLPAPAGSDSGWDGLLALDEMASLLDPPAGVSATANAAPPAGSEGGAWLGADWLDGYRQARIEEVLVSRDDWSIEACMELQLDVESLPWRELREPVLAALSMAAAGAAVADADVETAARLLAAWDGRVAADSAGAAVFELLMAELAVRAARRAAPGSWRHVLGAGFGGALPGTLFGARSVGRVADLVRGDYAESNALRAEVPGAAAAAVAALRERRGPDPSAWSWGVVRRLALRHLLSDVPRIGKAFGVAAVPAGGDSNTVSQAGVRPLDALGNPGAMANCRAVMDPVDPDASRFVLAGGQSGNPLSPHHADLFALWRRGAAVAIPWSEDAIVAATVATLVLEPAG